MPSNTKNVFGKESVPFFILYRADEPGDGVFESFVLFFFFRSGDQFWRERERESERLYTSV